LKTRLLPVDTLLQNPLIAGIDEPDPDQRATPLHDISRKCDLTVVGFDEITDFAEVTEEIPVATNRETRNNRNRRDIVVYRFRGMMWMYIARNTAKTGFTVALLCGNACGPASNFGITGSDIDFLSHFPPLFACL
jgi:hypothetical protein